MSDSRRTASSMREMRKATVKKEIELQTDSIWSSVDFSRLGLEINYSQMTVAIYELKGGSPYASDLIQALLSDKDVRRLIRMYQEKGRKNYYKIHHRVGMSGCEDFWIQVGIQNGSFFRKLKSKNLLHISCEGKLNEGWGDEENCMYIGDLVELVKYIGLTETMDVKVLRKKSKVKYVKLRYTGYLREKGYTTAVTNLL